ncbi:uncharacterized protein BO66DRAFT_442210 [Aspergillus aculeatinus CBS 121060]|uniref:Uncharacterized protein n=1 Tax=Aspergillus aculeatinus CBS 121060 TaxID=1448322 RepID=A0ACD1GYK0_9EURO|nr:hypothetical protein BO66DRAFT_442210 [Aspergillus aculeatinus CBS 121060]RAH66412.1 hypothetical protein BO66DRAFT_442210 [Aspergillus aculeatinus CBS 121060]
MDVLATTQPFSVNLAPSPTQLEAAVRRLLDARFSTTTYRLRHTELSTFLALLLRVRVSNVKWGRDHYFGSFADEDPADEVLANAMAARLIGSNKADFDKALELTMDALPNLVPRFHQLWTTLFQPPMSDFDVELEPKDENMLSRYLAAASLFVPLPEALTPAGLRDRHISHNKVGATQDEPILSLPSLVHHLQNMPDSHLILATNLHDPHAPATVIGSFIPSLLCAMSDSSSGTRSRKTGDAHLLFQLQLDFRLIRWEGPHTLLKTLIKTNYELASLHAVDAESGQQTREFGVIAWLK